jgi:hypothetical protein
MTLSGFIAAGIIGAAGVPFRALTNWYGRKFFPDPPEATERKPEPPKAGAASR